MNWGTCEVLGTATISCFEAVFSNIVAVIAILVGFVFLIMLIIGGFKYLTSSGDPKKAEAAKGTITAGFLGMILIISAYIILVLLGTFTGLTLTTFKIPTF